MHQTFPSDNKHSYAGKRVSEFRFRLLLFFYDVKRKILSKIMLIFFLNNIGKQPKHISRKWDTLPSKILIRITVRKLIDLQTILNEISLFKNVLCKNLLFVFLLFSFFSSDIVSSYNTVEYLEDILSILMMYSMSKYDIPELRYHLFSRTPPNYSTIPVVYP